MLFGASKGRKGVSSTPSETKKPSRHRSGRFNKSANGSRASEAHGNRPEQGLGRGKRGNARTVRCLPFPPTVIVGQRVHPSRLPCGSLCEALTGPVRVAARSVEEGMAERALAVGSAFVTETEIETENFLKLFT